MTVPLFLPSLALWTLLAVAIRVPLGRWLGISGTHAVAIIFSLGIIASATLTPQWAALMHGAQGPATCDTTRIWLAPLRVYLRFGDPLGNIFMFVPLGLALGLMPRNRHGAALVAAAFLIPFAVETTQLLVRVLDRACESGDVVDNLTGLVIGLVAGAILRWIDTRARSA